MDGIFLKLINIACREIANYPKYILKLPKGDNRKTFFQTDLLKLLKIPLINSGIITTVGFIRTFVVCAAQRKKSIIL